MVALVVIAESKINAVGRLQGAQSPAGFNHLLTGCSVVNEITGNQYDIRILPLHFADMFGETPGIKCCSDMRIGEQNYTEVFYLFGCFDCVVCGPDMVVKIPAGA